MGAYFIIPDKTAVILRITWPIKILASNIKVFSLPGWPAIKESWILYSITVCKGSKLESKARRGIKVII